MKRNKVNLVTNMKDWFLIAVLAMTDLKALFCNSWLEVSGLNQANPIFPGGGLILGTVTEVVFLRPTVLPPSGNTFFSSQANKPFSLTSVLGQRTPPSRSGPCSGPAEGVWVVPSFPAAPADFGPGVRGLEFG